MGNMQNNKSNANVTQNPQKKTAFDPSTQNKKTSTDAQTNSVKEQPIKTQKNP